MGGGGRSRESTLACLTQRRSWRCHGCSGNLNLIQKLADVVTQRASYVIELEEELS